MRRSSFKATQTTESVFAAIDVAANDVYSTAEFFLFCFEGDTEGVTRSAGACEACAARAAARCLRPRVRTARARADRHRGSSGGAHTARRLTLSLSSSCVPRRTTPRAPPPRSDETAHRVCSVRLRQVRLSRRARDDDADGKSGGDRDLCRAARHGESLTGAAVAERDEQGGDEGDQLSRVVLCSLRAVLGGDGGARRRRRR